MTCGSHHFFFCVALLIWTIRTSVSNSQREMSFQQIWLVMNKIHKLLSRILISRCSKCSMLLCAKHVLHSTLNPNYGFIHEPMSITMHVSNYSNRNSKCSCSRSLQTAGSSCQLVTGNLIEKKCWKPASRTQWVTKVDPARLTLLI